MRASPVTATATLIETGAVVLPAVLDAALVERLHAAARAAYARLARLVGERGPFGVDGALPAGVRYVPTASSVGVELLDAALVEDAHCAAERALAPVFAAVYEGPARRLTGEGWLRRQFPPSQAPPLHAPHSWHQDGGLGFDYLHGDPRTADALLPMVTCWMPLVACGREAPGMRYAPGHRAALIPYAELRQPPDAFVAPEMAPGDGLVMLGGTLHATHATPEMSRDRISVELRWLPAGHPGRP